MINAVTKLRGQALKIARKNKKISLRDMADLVSKKLGRELSYGSIRRYEEGSACDMDTLFAICEILDLDAIQLLDECTKKAKEEYDLKQ